MSKKQPKIRNIVRNMTRKIARGIVPEAQPAPPTLRCAKKQRRRLCDGSQHRATAYLGDRACELIGVTESQRIVQAGELAVLPQPAHTTAECGIHRRAGEMVGLLGPNGSISLLSR